MGARALTHREAAGQWRRFRAKRLSLAHGSQVRSSSEDKREAAKLPLRGRALLILGLAILAWLPVAAVACAVTLCL